MDKYEFSTDKGMSWREVSEHASVAFFAPGSVIFRIKPRTIKVNGFDVPEPMREAPKVNFDYFMPCITEESMFWESAWLSDELDSMRLSRNICHTTKEAAISHAKAMLGIDPNGGDE